MSVKGVDRRTRMAVSEILTRFLVNNDRNNRHLDALKPAVPSGTGPYQIQSSQLQSELGLLLFSINVTSNCSAIMSHYGVCDVEWTTQHRFLFLEPIKDEDILPFLTLQSSDNWRQFRIYALLALSDDKSKHQSLAIRFETPEGEYIEDSKRGKHDFFHAQLCKNIFDSSRIVVAQATTPEWLPTSQPSFPLDADNQVSLVLCMLTSLYGGRYVLSKFPATGDKNIQEYIQKVRALRTCHKRVSGQNTD